MLFIKMFRDIRHNLSQFLAIFLMIFLCVFVYVGIGSEIEGMNEYSSKFYKEANMPDLWALGTFSNDTEIAQIKGVKETTNKLTVSGNLANKDKTSLEINFISSDDISSLYIIEGEEFSYNSDKVWFDSALAKALDYEVGDTVTVKFNNLKITAQIAGLIMNPEHIYAVKDSSQVFPSHDDYGYVYFSSYAYPLGPENIIYNYTLIDTNQEEKVKSEVEKLTNVISVTDRSANTSYATFKTEVDSHKTYAGIFPLIFLFIAVLSVITTMNRIVKNQRNEIGILKALGFKKGKIILHYTMYSFVICLLAVILGHVLGTALLGNYILSLEEGYFEIPYLKAEVPYSYLLVSLLIVFIIALASYFSCFKELEGSAAETLRPKTPKKVKATWVEKLKIWHKLKFKTQWNLRDIFRSKVRSLMAIIGVAGATMLVVCAFGMLNTLNNYISWQYDDLYHFKNQILLDDTMDKNELIKKYAAGSMQTVGIEIQGDEDITSTISVDDSKGMVTYTNHDKEEINIPSNGVMISEKLAERLDLQKGDNITFKIYGINKLYTLEIVQINRAPSSQNITMTKDYYESLNLVYEPTVLYTNHDINDDIIYTSKDDLRENTSKMLNTMSSLIVIMIMAALLLGSVVVYNLGILSYTEKMRELATLKVLGFNSKMVGKVLRQQNIWLTIIGIIIGLPLGEKLVEIIFSTVMGYSFDIMPVVYAWSYVVSVMAIILATVIVNLILSKKVRSLDMVSSLKAAE